MKPNEQEWIRCLGIYGHDIDRWPIDVTRQDRARIIRMPDYAAAQSLDTQLDHVTWPSPSANMRDNLFAQIRQEALAAPVFILIRRPAYLLSCFALFLCLGLSVGAQYNAQDNLGDNSGYTSNSGYSYFTLSDGYAYSSTVEGGSDAQ